MPMYPKAGVSGWFCGQSWELGIQLLGVTSKMSNATQDSCPVSCSHMSQAMIKLDPAPTSGGIA